MNSSTPEFESGKKVEPQTTYHRLQTKTDGSSNLPGAIFWLYIKFERSEKFTILEKIIYFLVKFLN